MFIDSYITGKIAFLKSRCISKNKKYNHHAFKSHKIGHTLDVFKETIS